MRLRQLVFVSRERDELGSKICKLLDLKESYNDAGLINFGLENVLIPLGDTFFEIVTPVKENTTAERFLDKKGGDGGYMVIVDVENFEEEQERVETSGIEIVWHGNREEENIQARTIHLHPKQVGAAILSIDHMNPKAAWLWAGTDWEKDINKTLVDVISGVVLQSDNPELLCSKWEKALGKKRVAENNLSILLNESKISFVPDEDGRGEGINAFAVKTLDRNKILENAEKINALQNGNIYLGGVKIILD
ncbi:MAG: hypothetical protein CBD82_00850 [Gammaproteobacteria bacterium TMED222]|nr:MAG: hypothetical protein CBD82_00850 [Gammaproteobacteria bacterium TMED222]RZP01416.1 MAG: hypothetical protein EVA49_00210 [Gammaproteobacteria bacterium]|tara:strand:- start:1993 stop:2742 length:750 start_codon:yes stop_codon:yes gene_type:complete